MRLSIILTNGAYQKLTERGYLNGYARKAWRHHLPAYRWMADQMRERICPPPGRSKYPLWAWKQWFGRDKPDLRSSGHLPPGTKGHRLEIDVPDSDVLLSDFGLWSIVLNRGFLSYTEKEYDAFHRQLEKAGHSGLWPFPEPHHTRTVESWQRVFDIHRQPSDWWGAGESIQATFWRLNIDQVKKAQAFTAR